MRCGRHRAASGRFPGFSVFIMVATTRVKSLHTTPTFVTHIASIEQLPSDLDGA